MDDRERKARFDARFAKDYQLVLRFVECRVDDSQTAQDIASEAMLLLWKHDIGATPIGRAWLRQTATHLLGNHYKRAKRRLAAEESIHVLAVAENPELPTADVLILRDALKTLSPRARDIVALHYWHGLTASEIADTLGVTVSSVWTNMSRARDAMRAYLAQDDPARERITQA